MAETDTRVSWNGPTEFVAPPHPMAEPRPDVPATRIRRRARGLRFPALPSWALLAQLGGGAAVLTGVYQMWGAAVTAIVGGLGAILLGMLREAGKV